MKLALQEEELCFSCSSPSPGICQFEQRGLKKRNNNSNDIYICDYIYITDCVTVFPLVLSFETSGHSFQLRGGVCAYFGGTGIKVLHRTQGSGTSYAFPEKHPTPCHILFVRMPYKLFSLSLSHLFLSFHFAMYFFCCYH